MRFMKLHINPELQPFEAGGQCSTLEPPFDELLAAQRPATTTLGDCSHRNRDAYL